MNIQYIICQVLLTVIHAWYYKENEIIYKTLIFLNPGFWYLIYLRILTYYWIKLHRLFYFLDFMPY